MPSLVDYERFSEGQIQNLGAPSSNEWLAWRECQRCARALNDDGVPKLSLMFLAASFGNLFKLNQRAKLLGSTFQKRILTNISNCGVQYHLIYSVDMLSNFYKLQKLVVCFWFYPWRTADKLSWFSDMLASILIIFQLSEQGQLD